MSAHEETEDRSGKKGLDLEKGRARQLLDFATRIGVAINDLGLFDEALTHSSVVAETSVPCRDNESLEFLGDAVLGLAVSHYLFEHFPGRTPGEYSRMRAGLVNRRSVGRAASELDIASAIRLGKGEEQSGGRERKALMGDCLEAIIGAIYLDSGWDESRAFVVRVFREELARAYRLDQVWDFKSRLQNHCQGHRMALPEFVVVRSKGPDHRKEFEVEVLVQGEAAGRGKGASKKAAEQRAAREALEREGLQFGETVSSDK